MEQKVAVPVHGPYNLAQFEIGARCRNSLRAAKSA
jgi:hypothetical protein